MLFDAGVFLTVVGAVRLSLAQIARVEQRAERQPPSRGPMDIVFGGKAREPRVAERRAIAPVEPAPVCPKED
jgi:hypothetical protein